MKKSGKKLSNFQTILICCFTVNEEHIFFENGGDDLISLNCNQ